MLSEEDTTWVSDVALLASGPPAIHIIIVIIEEYEGNEKSRLECASVSANKLEAFWLGVAEGTAAFSANDPVGSVTKLNGCPNEYGSIEWLQRRLAKCFERVRPNDRLLVHWIGHGELWGSETHLVMPRLSGQAPGTLERAKLRYVIEWFAQQCKANRQLFFMDCCSTQVESAGNDWRKPVVREPRPNFWQKIYISSGLGRSAMGNLSIGTLFTNSFIGALTRFPSDDYRQVLIADHFVPALAGGVLEQLIELGWRLPDKEELRNETWVDIFVREEVPRQIHYRTSGAFMLGRAQSAHVGTCILTSPNNEDLPVRVEAVGLKQYWRPGEGNLTAFIGNAEPGDVFQVKFACGKVNETIRKTKMMTRPYVQDWVS